MIGREGGSGRGGGSVVKGSLVWTARDQMYRVVCHHRITCSFTQRAVRPVNALSDVTLAGATVSPTGLT